MPVELVSTLRITSDIYIVTVDWQTLLPFLVVEYRTVDQVGEEPDRNINMCITVILTCDLYQKIIKWPLMILKTVKRTPSPEQEAMETTVAWPDMLCITPFFH